MSFEYEKITVLEEFIGKTFSKIEVGKWKDELSFHIEDKVYKFIHYQECCEDVSIEDICGNLEDLINEPILMAEEYFPEPIMEFILSTNLLLEKVMLQSGGMVHQMVIIVCQQVL